MCCIFTCCGWMIDLIQRLWTFTMSCCISSAVCCSLVTASMSGVALGYNYSLAEYIDLKETNVSVYLKRGVFDDDIADDMDWRRSGHMPVKGHINDENLMTGPSDESSTFGPARRLDDSIFESNEKNNFEGALMKLTMKPPALKTSTTYPEVDVNSMVKKLPPDYLMFDKMKAIQVAVDKQKAAEAERRMTSREQPAVPEDSGRRMMPKVNFPSTTSTTQINSLRLAVPDPHFHAPGGWQEPKNSASKFGPFGDYPGHWTLPSPVTTAGPIRPTRRSTYRNAKPPSLTPPRTSIESFQTPPQDFKNDFEDINKRLLFDKFDDPSLREEEMEHKMKKRPNQSEEDYEEEIKGIPIRKKRNLEDTTVYPHKIDQTISKLFSLTTTDNIPSISESVNNIQSIESLSDTTFLRLILSSTIS